jgi:hypothetical protein
MCSQRMGVRNLMRPTAEGCNPKCFAPLAIYECHYQPA